MPDPIKKETEKKPVVQISNSKKEEEKKPLVQIYGAKVGQNFLTSASTQIPIGNKSKLSVNYNKVIGEEGSGEG